MDEGISGKSTRRPAFQELLKDVQKNYFQVILVWKINRFSRKNSDLLNTVEYLDKYNVNLVSCSEQFDASTPTGKLMLSMLGSIGEFERDTIVENIKSGMAERARQGLFNGGRILGYDSIDGRLSVNPMEASTVKRIFELFLSGSGYALIRDTINNEGRRTKNNMLFEINSIKRILKNPLYAGLISYNRSGKPAGRVLIPEETILVPGSHEALISREDFESTQRKILGKNRGPVSRGSFLLSPVLKCPECGGRMTGHSGGRKKDGSRYRYYVCLNYKNLGASACSSNCINAPHAERKVIDYLQGLVSNPQVMKDIYKKISNDDNSSSGQAAEKRLLKKELGEKQRGLNRYLKLYEAGSIEWNPIETRIRDLSREINTIQKRLDTLKQDASKGSRSISYNSLFQVLSGFKTLFMGLDHEIKKRILLSVVKEVTFDSNKNIKRIILTFSFLPGDDTRYTGSNFKCDFHT